MMNWLFRILRRQRKKWFWTEDEEKRLRDMVNQGYTYGEIARTLGRTRSAVTQHAQKMGILRWKRKFYNVVELYRYSMVCPAQWIGKLDNGRFILIWYRDKTLSIEVGKPGMTKEILRMENVEINEFVDAEGQLRKILNEVKKPIIKLPDTIVTNASLDEIERRYHEWFHA